MRMRKLILLCLLPSCLLSVAACASRADRALRSSPDFKAGYSDGCASANLQGADKRDGGPTRDDEAYQSNPAYHSGWGQGFGACRQMAAPQTPGGTPFGMPATP
jgi:hypothetical protein